MWLIFHVDLLARPLTVSDINQCRRPSLPSGSFSDTGDVVNSLDADTETAGHSVQERGARKWTFHLESHPRKRLALSFLHCFVIANHCMNLTGKRRTSGLGTRLCCLFLGTQVAVLILHACIKVDVAFS